MSKELLKAKAKKDPNLNKKRKIIKKPNRKEKQEENEETPFSNAKEEENIKLKLKQFHVTLWFVSHQNHWNNS